MSEFAKVEKKIGFIAGAFDWGPHAGRFLGDDSQDKEFTGKKLSAIKIDDIERNHGFNSTGLRKPMTSLPEKNVVLF